MTDYKNDPSIPAYITLKYDSYCSRGISTECQDRKRKIHTGTKAFWMNKKAICLQCGDPAWRGGGSNFSLRRMTAIINKKTPMEIRKMVLAHMWQVSYSSYTDMIQWCLDQKLDVTEMRDAIQILWNKNLLQKDDNRDHAPGAPFYAITPLGNHFDLDKDENLFPDYPADHPILKITES